MASLIKGVTVSVKVKTQTGVDGFGTPVWKISEEQVDNVLVGQPTTEDVADALNLHGKKVEYVLAIPKGDGHAWNDTEVILPEPFSGTYRTIGFPTAGIEENMPLAWNKKVRLERYG